MAARGVAGPDAGDKNPANGAIGGDHGVVGGGVGQRHVVYIPDELGTTAGYHNHALWHSDFDYLFVQTPAR